MWNNVVVVVFWRMHWVISTVRNISYVLLYIIVVCTTVVDEYVQGEGTHRNKLQTTGRWHGDLPLWCDIRGQHHLLGDSR